MNAKPRILITMGDPGAWVPRYWTAALRQGRTEAGPDNGYRPEKGAENFPG